MMAHAVLETRVDYLEEWRRAHSIEDDTRHEAHSERLRVLEIRWARLTGAAVVGSFVGGGLIHLVITLASKLF